MTNKSFLETQQYIIHISKEGKGKATSGEVDHSTTAARFPCDKPPFWGVRVFNQTIYLSLVEMELVDHIWSVANPKNGRIRTA